MTTEQFIIVALSSVCSLLLVGLLWMIGTKDVQTKTVEKKVPVVKINYKPQLVKEWLLKVGVANAWVTRDSVSGKKADCFSTVLLSNDSAFSYCELRR